MHLKHLILSLGFGALTISGSPLLDIFERAVGDTCKAPEGTGACKHTADCPGISYPTNLCPRDPDDVQVCLSIDLLLDSFHMLTFNSAV
jgi:hypothetical protein